MNTYIGLKCVSGHPLDEVTAIAQGIARARDIEPTADDPLCQRGRPGYRVLYGDNYVSWSPADVFEKDYRQVPAEDAAHILVAAGAELDRLANGGLVNDAIEGMDAERRDEGLRCSAMHYAVTSFPHGADHVELFGRTAKILAFLRGEEPLGCYEPGEQTTISLSTLMEALSAIYGARAALGDIANLSEAIRKLEGDTGVTYNGFAEPIRDTVYASALTGSPADTLLDAGQTLRATFDISTPIDALRMCAETFRAYEKHHLAKLGDPYSEPTDEANRQKAQRNGLLAVMCERIIDNEDEVRRVMGPPPGSFRDHLTQVINHWSVENGSNTPDFILARYLASALTAFEGSTIERDRWYGRDHGNSPAQEAPMPDTNLSPIPDGKPLYQLYRETLDDLRKLCAYCATGEGSLSGDDIIAISDRGVAAIDAAIAERDAPAPTSGARDEADRTASARFTIGEGFEGGEDGQPQRRGLRVEEANRPD